MQLVRSYVVRVYRQDAGQVVCVVEDVRTGLSKPFHSPSELWNALDENEGAAGARSPGAPNDARERD